MSIAIFITDLVRNMPNLYNDLQVNAVICNTSSYKVNHQIIGSFLTGILIKYFTFKKKKCLSFSPHENKKTKGSGDYFRAFLLMFMVFFSWFSISKRETRDSFPQSPGQCEELFYKKYLYCVFLPCWRGSCSFHSDTDTATLKGGWVACLSKFKCLDSKRKKKKEMWKKVLI